MAAEARLEIRISSATKEYLERLLEDHLAVTRVRADVFEALLATIEEPPVPDEPLRRAARTAADHVRRA